MTPAPSSSTTPRCVPAAYLALSGVKRQRQQPERFTEDLPVVRRGKGRNRGKSKASNAKGKGAGTKAKGKNNRKADSKSRPGSVTPSAARPKAAAPQGGSATPGVKPSLSAAGFGAGLIPVPVPHTAAASAPLYTFPSLDADVHVHPAAMLPHVPPGPAASFASVLAVPASAGASMAPMPAAVAAGMALPTLPQGWPATPTTAGGHHLRAPAELPPTTAHAVMVPTAAGTAALSVPMPMTVPPMAAVSMIPFVSAAMAPAGVPAGNAVFPFDDPVASGLHLMQLPMQLPGDMGLPDGFVL